MEKAVQNSFLGGDERVQGWLFMDSPRSTLYTLAAYLAFVWLGPKFMRDRKPLQLKNVMVVYNAFQVCLSFYMFQQFLLTSYQLNYSYICQPMDHSMDEKSIKMARAVWLFYFSKFIDLLDTIFIVLRKKNNQISFLHVYHHAIMLSFWIAAKYGAGGHIFFTCMLNSLVHTVMYTYYTLASLGPVLQPYLWWKKYLTQLQLIQFIVIMSHIGLGFYKKCKYPHFLGYFSLLNLVTFVALFINFYTKAYWRRGKAAAAAAKGGEPVANGYHDKGHQNSCANGVAPAASVRETAAERRVVRGSYDAANGFSRKVDASGYVIANGACLNRMAHLALRK